jgi:pectate lyase
MKKVHIILLMFLFAVLISAGTIISAATTDDTITITESGGSFESTYVEWEPNSDASGYNVYYKSSSDSSYTKISNMLIREYSSHYRADIPGLPEGSYTIKVTPVINNSEGNGSTVTTSVEANVREGFAFTETSSAIENPGCGGYEKDGSVPSDAQILYISKNTVNTIALDVITSSSGSTTSCTGLSEIMAARKKGYDLTPLIIRVIGTITDSDIDGLNSSGYLEVKGCYNVTLEGIGEDATVSGWGILVRAATNVEVRNLGIMLFPDDGISIDTDNTNIWIHNNDIFYGTAGSDSDQAKGDGSCDLKKSSYITVSYNHFWDSGKALLCGLGESSEFFVTYHHNWFDHSDSRHPRVRTGSIHVYNNYYDGISKYGVGATTGSSIFVEANYFRNCKYPMLISLQGSDIYNSGSYDGDGTFSDEEGGIIKSYNNTITGETRFVDQNDESTQFDAITVSSANEEVSSNYTTVSGGNTYNNFDTNSSIMYDYNADSPDDVVSIVEEKAGRLNGGDFSWDFDDESDDTDYSVNSDLMSAIKSYTSDLVSICGESSDDDSSESTETSTDSETTATAEPTSTTSDDSSDSSGSYIHNFTTDGLDSDFYSISGNLSTSKGTVTYDDLTLTQCLKIESSTSIEFTTTESITLTLVFNPDNSSNIKVDGTTYDLTSDGLLTLDIDAGTHEITKKSVGNLYYMSLD